MRNNYTWQEKFERARQLAFEAHKNQKYGDLPYAFHLQAVVDVLQSFGATLEDEKTAPLLVAAWLHDTLEDTDLDLQIIRDEMGADVAEIVWRVTDEPSRNRKERKSATYQKTKESIAAVTVKLADRIANVAASKKSNPQLLAMYTKEQSEFYQALYTEPKNNLAESLWQQLNSCFDNAQT